MKHWSWLLPAPLSTEFPLIQSANGCRMWLKLETVKVEKKKPRKVLVFLRSLPSHSKILCSIKPPQPADFRGVPRSTGQSPVEKEDASISSVSNSWISSSASPGSRELTGPGCKWRQTDPRAKGTETLTQDQCHHTAKPEGTWGHCCGFSSSHPLLLPLIYFRDSCRAKKMQDGSAVGLACVLLFPGFLSMASVHLCTEGTIKR